jgi:hypothetical protein
MPRAGGLFLAIGGRSSDKGSGYRPMDWQPSTSPKHRFPFSGHIRVIVARGEVALALLRWVPVAVGARLTMKESDECGTSGSP